MQKQPLVESRRVTMWVVLWPLLFFAAKIVAGNRAVDHGRQKSVLGHNSPNIVYFNSQITQVYPDEYNVHPPYNERWRSEDASIVILIAALREERCADTLEMFFDRAKYPNRVHIALVQQNLEEDMDCYNEFCRRKGYPDPSTCVFNDRARITRMSANDAKGPVFARGLGADLVTENDDFCMQIDAHTLVVQDWDMKMLSEWGATRNEYAVLTTYPSAPEHLGKNVGEQWNMPILCDASIAGNGVVVNERASACANLERPILGPLWAAGLSFHRFHTALRCITLHHTLFQYIALRYVTLHHVTFHYVTLHYVTLVYATLDYITLHYITLHYITLQYTTLHYITLRYITSRCITLHCIALRFEKWWLHRSILLGATARLMCPTM
jgi:hypothetical protein